MCVYWNAMIRILHPLGQGEAVVQHCGRSKKIGKRSGAMQSHERRVETLHLGRLWACVVVLLAITCLYNGC